MKQSAFGYYYSTQHTQYCTGWTKAEFCSLQSRAAVSTLYFVVVLALLLTREVSCMIPSYTTVIETDVMNMMMIRRGKALKYKPQTPNPKTKWPWADTKML